MPGLVCQPNQAPSGLAATNVNELKAAAAQLHFEIIEAEIRGDVMGEAVLSQHLEDLHAEIGRRLFR